MQKLAIVALKYLEPDYQQTIDCLEKASMSYPVFYADRDGVGNMSRAFNEAFVKYVQGRFEYVWFVTNIIFESDVPDQLLQFISFCEFGGIHPSMKGSDHRHQWPNDTPLNIVPFIELTAPMFRCDLFEKFMLCEQTPYYYMDLIISNQLLKAGFAVAVAGEVEIKHTYLRNREVVHPISEIRKRLRNYWTPISKKYMVDTYGADWETYLWPKI